MKRWWTTPQQRPARVNRRRVGRVLAPAMMAGAMSLPLARGAGDQVIHARTSGAVVAAWAFGTLSEASQPESRRPCDLAHVCELAISSSGGTGTGTGATIKNILETSTQTDPATNLPFTLTETIDYQHPVTKGVPGKTGQAACYPANGVVTITASTTSALVLDIVGQACQVGQNPTQVIFTGSYVSDEASTGSFANTDGIGQVSINNPSGLEGSVTTMKASFQGQLKYTP